MKIALTTLAGRTVKFFSCGHKKLKKNLRKIRRSRDRVFHKFFPILNKRGVRFLIFKCDLYYRYRGLRTPRLSYFFRTKKAKKIILLKKVLFLRKPHNGCRKKSKKR